MSLSKTKTADAVFVLLEATYPFAFTIRADSRDFLRAAVVSLITPRLAALSIAL
jgi:hypothetical protein